jgi:hypothetical protein
MKARPLIMACAAAFGSVVFVCVLDVFAARTGLPPVPPEHARMAEVSIWEHDASGRRRFPTFEASYARGAHLAAGDMDGDGSDEIVLGAGPDRLPEVRIYETDGTLVKTFRAYESWFKGGVRVAVGDTDDDGVDEIITAPGPGMVPLIHVFNAKGEHELEGGALAYMKEFRGGVHLAVQDMDGDGTAEIITAPGPGGGPHVRIFSGRMENIGKDFFAFDEGARDGITVAAVNTPFGAQIVVGAESWSRPMVRRFALTDRARLLREFDVFDPVSHSGVTVAPFDADGDGIDEIVTAQNGGTAPEVRIFDMFGTLMSRYLFHDPTYRGALSFVQLDADADGRRELATVALAPVVNGPVDAEKKIIVDLADQRLYAYEHGRTANTFFISSGIRKYATPEIETEVLEKIPVKRYRWTYGPNHPDNYDLPNVKWNLRVFGAVYIHGAYWHNNFGYRMSHGCVNMRESEAEWVYNWADVGTPVAMHY